MGKPIDLEALIIFKKSKLSLLSIDDPSRINCDRLVVIRIFFIPEDKISYYSSILYACVLYYIYIEYNDYY